MKKISYILLILILATACYRTTSKTVFFDRVTYAEKVSLLTRKKYPFNPDERAREPRRTYWELTFLKDSITKIKYSERERMKRHKEYGKFYFLKTKVDTVRVKSHNNWSLSERMLSGEFKAPKDAIRTHFHSEKGIVFNRDGSCVHSYGSSASDSPISSSHQRLGEYMIRNDTLFIVYFLGKDLTISHHKLRDTTTTTTIDDIWWQVIEPYEVNYLISINNDTLRTISRNTFHPTLVSADSVKVIPIKR